MVVGTRADGGPDRQAQIDAVLAALYGNRLVQRVAAAVRQRRLAPVPNPHADEQSGAVFGCEQAGMQDAGAALLANQLVSAEAESIEQFMAAADELQHPGRMQSDDCPRIWDEFRAAARFAMHSEEYERELTERGRFLAVSARLLEQLSADTYAAYAPQHIRCAAFSPPNCALIAALVLGLDRNDRELPARLVLGALPTGELQPMGCWAQSDDEPFLGVAYDDLPHDQWNKWLRDSVAQRACASDRGMLEAREVWAATIQEVDEGLMDGPWEVEDIDAMYGADSYRALRRFGVEQKGRLRG